MPTKPVIDPVQMKKLKLEAFHIALTNFIL